MKTGRAPETSEVSAGPGQKPPSPHPTPKMAAPAISLASRSLRLGSAKLGANRGDGIFALQRYATKYTAIAPSMTKPKLASHAPKKSRKPITLIGRVIPEIPRPSANTVPETKDASNVFIVTLA